jgi:hypothetical protein
MLMRPLVGWIAAAFFFVPIVALAAVPTVSTIVSAPDPSGASKPFLVTFRVDSEGGAPAGEVVVHDTNDNFCVGTLDGGAGSCFLSIPQRGEATLYARYSGSGTFDPSRSPGHPHVVTEPPFDISGAPSATFDAGYTLDFANLAPPDASVEVFIDNAPAQRIAYDSPPPSTTIVFQYGPLRPGCHVVSAINEDASATPLGVSLVGSGLDEPCVVGTAEGNVAVASAAADFGDAATAPDATTPGELAPVGVSIEATLPAGATSAVVALASVYPGNPLPSSSAPPESNVFFEVRLVDAPAGTVVVVTFRYTRTENGDVAIPMWFDEGTGAWRDIAARIELDSNGDEPIARAFLDDTTSPTPRDLRGTFMTIRIPGREAGTDASPPYRDERAEASVAREAGKIDDGITPGEPERFVAGGGCACRTSTAGGFVGLSVACGVLLAFAARRRSRRSRRPPRSIS